MVLDVTARFNKQNLNDRNILIESLVYEINYISR